MKRTIKTNQEYNNQNSDNLKFGHRKRLRDKFIKAPNGYSECINNREIVEMLLFYVYPRRDVSNLSRELLRNNCDLKSVIYMDKENPIMTDNLYVFFKLIRYVIEGSLYISMKKQSVLSSWSALISYLKTSMEDLNIEYCKILFLDAKYRLISDEVISSGNETVVILSIREIVKKIIFHNAFNIIITHNHPGDSSQPSDKDISTTNELIKACRLFEVSVLDHIIIGKKDIYSFKENGLI